MTRMIITHRKKLTKAALIALLGLSVMSAADTRTGAYTMSSTVTDVFNGEGASQFEDSISPSETLEWEVFVPDDPTDQDAPGILVYMSPSNSGHVPRGWTTVLRQKNLIWISANDSGNAVEVPRRIALAIVGLSSMLSSQTINEDRIYLAGFSGGARVGSLLASQLPHIFDGGIFVGGAEMWHGTEAQIDLDTMRQNRYVFMVGTNDFNRRMARNVYSSYLDHGVENVDFVVMSGQGHELPRSWDFRSAVSYLDGPSLDSAQNE